MHLVITCPQCRKQYNGDGRTPGSRYRCPCGGVLEIPRLQAHDAAVIRCSSCGAPRESAAAACRYCGGDFTLREQDLDAVCSQCLARVSSRTHYCHSCGSPVQMRTAAEESDLPCPGCGGERKLARRKLGETSASIFDCEVCGGIWVEKEVFEVLAERARADTLPDLSLRASGESGGSGGPAAPKRPSSGSFYRCCATCGTRMNRRNWGQKSGVIVDVCQHHGVWFDLDELGNLLRWIRTGGETVPRRAAEAERAAIRHLAISGTLRDLDSTSARSSGKSVLGALAAGFLGGTLTGFFDR
jgi:Zn-finger nucleic acid-binding protein